MSDTPKMGQKSPPQKKLRTTQQKTELAMQLLFLPWRVFTAGLLFLFGMQDKSILFYGPQMAVENNLQTQGTDKEHQKELHKVEVEEKQA